MHQVERDFEHGSSPRPWGTRRRSGWRQSSRRFIPTPVGNARARWPAAPRSTVHPHARGERRRPSAAACLSHGSSPRPWGTLRGRSSSHLHMRFIPTPVGNAVVVCKAPAPRSVHPHARGERAARPDRISGAGGSSPRPWGTLDAALADAEDERFIPTPVGNAPSEIHSQDDPAVHPHARGERGRAVRSKPMPPGSSPRPWGTR